MRQIVRINLYRVIKDNIMNGDESSYYQKICDTLSQLLSTQLTNHQFSESHERMIITYEIRNQHMNYKLKNFPKYQLVQEDDIHEICMICLENLSLKSYKRTLLCNHCFHKKCIDKWILDYKPSCPLCLKDYKDLLNE